MPRSLPSDVVTYGAITGRTSGLITTLPNAKSPRKLGSSIKHQVHWAPEGCKFVSFDFSALELVISAAYNSLEQCRFEDVPADPMYSKAAQLVFNGKSSEGTDVHTVVSKQVGISRSATKTLEYAPLGPECLVNTRGKGWISIKDVKEGDLVDAQNLDTGSRVWTPVSKTYAYKNHNSLRIKVGKLDFVTTHDHRWPAFDARTKKFKGYKQTQQLTGEDCLAKSFKPYASNFVSEAQSILSPDEARLLMWLLSDGSWQVGKTKAGTPSGYSGGIAQSKPKFVSDIAKLLARMGLPNVPKLKKPGLRDKLPCYVFAISSSVIRNLLDKATGNTELKHKKDFALTDILPKLSLKALRAMFSTLIKAEGTYRPHKLSITQSIISSFHNDVERLANLCGFSVWAKTHKAKPGELSQNDCTNFLIQARRTISWQRVSKEETTADVYCITTETSNFFTKICGQTILTGNCLYGSGLAGLQAVARPEMTDISEAELKEKCQNFMSMFKGHRVRNGQQFAGGLFSHFFNYAQYLVSQSQPRLPFLKTGITSALTPAAVGPDYITSRLNWTVQGSGSELHDAVLVKALELTEPGAAALWSKTRRKFYGSVHDDLAFLVQDSGAEAMAAAIKEAHAWAWEQFFIALGFEGAPQAVKENIQVNIDQIWRKEPDLWVDGHRDYQDLPPESKPSDGLLV